MNPCYYLIEWFYEYLFRNPCFIPEFVYYIEFVWLYCNICLFLAFCKSVLKFVCIFVTYVHFLQFVYCSGICMGFWCNFLQIRLKTDYNQIDAFCAVFIANRRVLIWIEFGGDFNEFLRLNTFIWTLFCKLSIMIMLIDCSDHHFRLFQ